MNTRGEMTRIDAARSREIRSPAHSQGAHWGGRVVDHRGHQEREIKTFASTLRSDAARRTRAAGNT